MKTGQELLEEISKYPTLDILLDRDPHAIPYTNEELLSLINRERAERALFTIREQEKKDKPKGVKK